MCACMRERESCVLHTNSNSSVVLGQHVSRPICVEYSIYVLEQRSYLIPPNELQDSISNMMSLL